MDNKPRKKRIYRRSGFTCIFCQRYFPCTVDKFTHIRRHINEKPYYCGHCDYTAVCSTAIRGHILAVHSTEKFPCSECSKVCNSIKVLKEHWKIEHSQNKPRFQCEICKKEFKKTTNLSRHQRTHTRAALKPLKCEDCGKGFADMTGLKRHLDKYHRILKRSYKKKKLNDPGNPGRRSLPSPEIKVEQDLVQSSPQPKEESISDWDLIAEIY